MDLFPDNPAPLVLPFRSDPGHGWLEVPCSLLRQLGIAYKVSGYSYLTTDAGYAYLEEDCDAPLLLMALRDKGIPYKVDERRPCGGNSKIRNLPRFDAAKVYA